MFTNDEILFLNKHKIYTDEILDARRMRQKDYQVIAKEQMKKLVLTSSGCKKLGHRIRTRHGQCAQCNKETVSIALRGRQSGSVYIMISKSKNLLKVGFAQDVFERVKTLTSQKYAGATDWEVAAYLDSHPEGGRVEISMGKNLNEHRSSIEYVSTNGHSYVATECFAIKLKTAREAMKEFEIIPTTTLISIKPDSYFDTPSKKSKISRISPTPLNSSTKADTSGFPSPDQQLNTLESANNSIDLNDTPTIKGLNTQSEHSVFTTNQDFSSPPNKKWQFPGNIVGFLGVVSCALILLSMIVMPFIWIISLLFD